jgi:predicted MPP superfamily phosphohydrolase
MTNKPNHRWIYTYDYAPNEIWDEWRISPTPADWIDAECSSVSERVNKDLPKFALIADSHYTINGTWEDTAYALRKLHEAVDFDGVIHLGDLTDGMLSAYKTTEIENIVKKDLRSLNVPIHIVYGNHDYNYFKGNPDLVYPDKPQYYTDYSKHKLRLIFIDSFDPKEQLRYGFSNECVSWLDKILSETQSDWSVIVFSHLTPLVQLQAWAKEIRNSSTVMEVLNKHSNKILAFINGHNHCDHLYNGGRFPIISINCSKCECFLEHKPEGAVVPYRELGNKTQESFDIMTIDSASKIIHFTRFGAGNDRTVENGIARWV